MFWSFGKLSPNRTMSQLLEESHKKMREEIQNIIDVDKDYLNKFVTDEAR